jgi:uncharacterized membrane protein YebE (DUF533 family)
MKTLTIAALALVAMTAGAAAYDARDARIDRRENIQENRIQQGVRSGEITRREHRQLEAEQARIRDMERQAKRDGHIDRREAAAIERAQDAASRHISQEKHDADRRRWW